MSRTFGLSVFNSIFLVHPCLFSAVLNLRSSNDSSGSRVKKRDKYRFHYNNITAAIVLTLYIDFVRREHW